MIKNILEKITSPLTVVAAAGCPACFPALTGLGSALGLSFLAPYSAVFLQLFQILVIVSLVSLWYNYRKHRNKAPLYLGVIASLMIFGSYYGFIPVYSVIYVGMGLLIIASFSDVYIGRMCRDCNTTSA